MRPLSTQVKVLLVSTIFVFFSYVLWNSLFGIKAVDPELKREAEANVPECNYGKVKIDANRIYTQKELDESSAQAKACIDAVIKYLKAKEAAES